MDDALDNMLPTEINHSQAELSHLLPTQAAAVNTILRRHEAAFSQNDNDIGYCPIIHHSIEVSPDIKPIAKRQYPFPQAVQTEMHKQCRDMLKMEVIEKVRAHGRAPPYWSRKKTNHIDFVLTLEDSTLLLKMTFFLFLDLTAFYNRSMELNSFQHWTSNQDTGKYLYWQVPKKQHSPLLVIDFNLNVYRLDSKPLLQRFND